MDIQQLVKGCKKGDSKAQKSLYYAYYPTLMHICTRYIRDHGETEQLVHDSFLKIFKRIDSYKSDGSFEGWMKRICINTCLDHYRHKQSITGINEANTVYPEDFEAFNNHFIPNDVISKLSVDAILKLVERLPQKERLVFQLHVLDGIPHDEISDMLDIKPNHSYWLLHNARKQLQALLLKTA